MEETIELLQKVKPKSVSILSGDPALTSDYRRLPTVLKKEIGCHVRLITNGHILPDFDGLTHVSMSIKAVSDRFHKKYTGQSNRQCLENLQTLYRKGIVLSVSSVYIPGLIDQDEIEGIARFIAGVDKDIPFRVIGYMKVDGFPYREPDREELSGVADMVGKHLSNVVFSRSRGEDYTGIIDLFTNNLRK